MSWSVALVLVFLISGFYLSLCIVVTSRYAFRRKLLEAASKPQLNVPEIQRQLSDLEKYVGRLADRRRWYQ